MIRLRELREKRGLSMKDAADLLNMPYTTYVNYEKGTREPNIEALFRLADFFEVTIDELLERCAPNEPLTLDELREMDGEPVWTVGVSYTNDGKWAMWDIVEKADDEGVDFGRSTEGREWWNYNLRGNDGKLLDCAWACYRRPPEGEEDV